MRCRQISADVDFCLSTPHSSAPHTPAVSGGSGVSRHEALCANGLGTKKRGGASKVRAQRQVVDAQKPNGLSSNCRPVSIRAALAKAQVEAKAADRTDAASH